MRRQEERAEQEESNTRDKTLEDSSSQLPHKAVPHQTVSCAGSWAQSCLSSKPEWLFWCWGGEGHWRPSRTAGHPVKEQEGVNKHRHAYSRDQHPPGGDCFSPWLEMAHLTHLGEDFNMSDRWFISNHLSQNKNFLCCTVLAFGRFFSHRVQSLVQEIWGNREGKKGKMKHPQWQEESQQNRTAPTYYTRLTWHLILPEVLIPQMSR